MRFGYERDGRDSSSDSSGFRASERSAAVLSQGVVGLPRLCAVRLFAEQQVRTTGATLQYEIRKPALQETSDVLEREASLSCDSLSWCPSTA